MRNPFQAWAKYHAVPGVATDNERGPRFHHRDISADPETNGLMSHDGGGGNGEDDEPGSGEKAAQTWPLQRRLAGRAFPPGCWGILLVVAALLLLLLATFLFGMFMQSVLYAAHIPLAEGPAPAPARPGTAVPDPGRERCAEPAVRREWRSLDAGEKKAYLDGVQCLMERPSRLGLESSLYEDFPWVHSRTGKYVNSAAPFLAWHRYFIHSYEQAMQHDCGYKGVLAYWDWSLDWEALSHSPIFSATTGFGGTGTPNANATAALLPLLGPEGTQTIGIGHCVRTGPFADTTFAYLGDAHVPHCFSRHLNDTVVTPTDPSDQWRYHLRPSALDTLLSTPDYDVLNIGIEDWQHNAIPNLVGGDFMFFTSPYDPLFYLHHAQLDRLWWLWQNADLDKRLLQYRGAAEAKSSEAATLDDWMLMGGFVEDVRARDVVDTMGGVLCYRY